VDPIYEINTQAPELLALLPKSAQGSWLVITTEHPYWMRIKRNHGNGAPACQLLNGAQHVSVTEVDTIEVAKRYNPTTQAIRHTRRVSQ
jgi:hypothetical protein